MFLIKNNNTEAGRLNKLYPTNPILLLGDRCYVFRDLAECSCFVDTYINA